MYFSVSLCSTNIVMIAVSFPLLPVCSGLLGAHVVASSLKSKGESALSWYNNELLGMAQDLGERLSPAFATPTGIPYARVS